MATSLPTNASSEDVTKRFLTCALCLEPFNRPKILPCLHSFCADCLDMYMKKSNVLGTFPCPLCRTNISTTPMGIGEYKDNFFINTLLDFFDSERKCTMCDLKGVESSASSKCVECSDYLCENCTKSHGETRLTHQHQILSLGTIASKAEAEELKSRRNISCAEHRDENFRYFCLPCEKTICRDCKILSHLDHKCVTFQEAITEKRRILESNLNTLVELRRNRRSQVCHQQSSEKRIEKDCDIIEGVISDRYNELMKAITCVKDKLLTENRQLFEKQLQQKHDNVKMLTGYISQLDNFDYYLRALLSKGADVEILDSFSMVKDRIRELASVTISANLKTIIGDELQASADNAKAVFSTLCMEAMREWATVNRNVAKPTIIQKLGHPDINADVHTYNSLAMGKERNIYVSYNGKIWLHDSATWQNISQAVGLEQLFAYSVAFQRRSLLVTFRAQGRKPCRLLWYNCDTKVGRLIDLEFSCSNPGLAIGRNDSIFVTDSSGGSVEKLSPRGVFILSRGKGHLEQPVHVTENRNTGNLIVCDRAADDVYLLDSFERPRSLKKSIPEGKSSTLLSFPCCAAMDSENRIYVAGRDSHNVLVFSGHGDHLSTLLTAQDGIQYPTAIALKEQKLVLGHAGGVWIYKDN